MSAPSCASSMGVTNTYRLFDNENAQLRFVHNCNSIICVMRFVKLNFQLFTHVVLLCSLSGSKRQKDHNRIRIHVQCSQSPGSAYQLLRTELG